MSLADALKRIKDNPDDLTELPQIIEQVAAREQEIADYQKRIVEMQELNRKYLAMVPIAGEEPEQVEETKPATLDDAREYLVGHFGKDEK